MLTEAPDFAPDVFLCHNSQDKEAVRTINQILRQFYGLSTYLDEGSLVGGEEWERAIQAALARSRSCAVIVGPNGWGKYQLEHEVRPALRRRALEPAYRVIPVLLPGADVEALAEFGAFFGQTHWVTFTDTADDATVIRTLSYAVRGENAFPEGPPRLTASRVRFDAIRWDAGLRRDSSLLYTGAVMRDAAQLAAAAGSSIVTDFLAASRLHHDQGLARQLAAHASVMWTNPRRRNLAAQLALESVRRFATAEGTGVLRQAYAALHRTVGTLRHPAPVSAAARRRDGASLATGCSDGSVCIWNGAVLRVLGTHAATVRAVADLGTGQFVSASADGSCIVWSWESGERVRAFQAGETVETLDVRRSGERTLLLTSGGFPGRPGQVALWNVEEGAELWSMGMVTHAVLDAQGTAAALAWGDHVVLRGVGGELLARQPLNATVIGVATHPVQPFVAATTVDRRACLISFQSDPADVRELGGGISRIGPIRISPNGRYVAAVRDDFTVALWDLTDSSRRSIKYEGLMSVDLQFSDDTRYLAVVSPEATAVTVWRVEDGAHVCTIEQDAPSVAIFDDARNGLWTASDGPVASFFEMPRQSEALSTASPGIATAVAYGPQGDLAWCGFPVAADLKIETGNVALWVADPLSGTTRVDAALSESGRIVFDSKGTRVAVVGADRVRVWELATGAETAPPESPFWVEQESGDEEAVANLLASKAAADACAQRGRVGTRVSPDGRFVAVDHGQQLVSLWRTSDAAEVVSFSTVAAVAQMAFSPDGMLLATGDTRGGVMLWQTDGRSLGQVQHDEPIAHLAFSPDGQFLAVASMDSMLRVWIASPDLLARLVGQSVGGALSDEQWTRYLGDEPRAEAAAARMSTAS